ncbi:hypothetical protein AB1Y20_013915 [Prymnesium parvum]|uniref:Aspartate/glutamate/uridylate kinase domain-containing protein n=1 Tax=Prymnesium parvum TaxID=97485 RepID=A0AB34IEZ3_PRYPA
MVPKRWRQFQPFHRDEIRASGARGMATAYPPERRGLRFARRIAVKAGTPVLTHMDGNIALGRIGILVEQIAALRHEGREVLLVTSGAIGAGSSRMLKNQTLASNMHETMHQSVEPPNQNAAAAVGQSLIMSMYETFFSKYNLGCAQVLVTEQDIADPEIIAQVGDTTNELLQLGFVPIINENDAVTSRVEPVFSPDTREVQWDNDTLAARLAAEVKADLLVVLTDIDGLYTKHADDALKVAQRLPVFSPGAILVRQGIEFQASTASLGDDRRGDFEGRTRMSEQGLQSLVSSAIEATRLGVRAVVVTSGHHPRALFKAVRGEDIGTLFLPPPEGKL